MWREGDAGAARTSSPCCAGHVPAEPRARRRGGGRRRSTRSARVAPVAEGEARRGRRQADRLRLRARPVPAPGDRAGEARVADRAGPAVLSGPSAAPDIHPRRLTGARRSRLGCARLEPRDPRDDLLRRPSASSPATTTPASAPRPGRRWRRRTPATRRATATTAGREARRTCSARCSRPTARSSSSSTARRQLARARLALPAPTTASSATRPRTWRRTSAARRSSSPTAPRCSPSPGEHGKVEPDGDRRVRAPARRHPLPQAARGLLTQATELGTVYTPAELRALWARAKAPRAAHAHGRRPLRQRRRRRSACAPKEITWQAGVDVLCFGGTKNGMAAGEAVVFFNRELAREFDYRCKQAGQLASKMRFLAAPWVGMLRDGAWLRHARQRERDGGGARGGARGRVPGVALL